jgi:hypothetical protein
MIWSVMAADCLLLASSLSLACLCLPLIACLGEMARDQDANKAAFRWIHSQLNVSHGHYVPAKGLRSSHLAPCPTRLLQWQ